MRKFQSPMDPESRRKLVRTRCCRWFWNSRFMHPSRKRQRSEHAERQLEMQPKTVYKSEKKSKGNTKTASIKVSGLKRRKQGLQSRFIPIITLSRTKIQDSQTKRCKSVYESWVLRIVFLNMHLYWFVLTLILTINTSKFITIISYDTVVLCCISIVFPLFSTCSCCWRCYPTRNAQPKKERREEAQQNSQIKQRNHRQSSNVQQAVLLITCNRRKAAERFATSFDWNCGHKLVHCLLFDIKLCLSSLSEYIASTSVP